MNKKIIIILGCWVCKGGLLIWPRGRARRASAMKQDMSKAANAKERVNCERETHQTKVSKDFNPMPGAVVSASLFTGVLMTVDLSLSCFNVNPLN